MTRDEIDTALSAILTTALDTEPAPFPASMPYIALGCDMPTWEAVNHVLDTAGLAYIEGDCIHLTERGRDIARQCKAHLSA